MADDVERARDKALDVFVYWPIGLAAYARDAFPTLFRLVTARGKTEIDKQRRRVTGLRAQAEKLVDAGRSAVPGDDHGDHRRRVEPDQPDANSRLERSAPPTPTVPAVDLAIPDYDELSASQVAERLEGLGRGELTKVRRYEESNRGRRTILFKIDQLTA